MPGKPQAAPLPPVISESEIGQRMAVLRRFKTLLLEQKQRFSRYIEILDRQKTVIENGKSEEILAYVDLMEKNIIPGIAVLQKSIEPMRSLYESVTAKTVPGGVNEIPEINRALENLKTEAFRRAEENKTLLQKRAALIGNELKKLRGNPFNKRKSIYANDQGATLFDISG